MGELGSSRDYTRFRPQPNFWLENWKWYLITFFNFLETLTRAMVGYWAMVNLEKREKLFMGSLITWRQTFIEEILWEHKNTSFQFYFTFFEGKVEGALVSKKKNHTHPFPFSWRDKKRGKMGGNGTIFLFFPFLLLHSPVGFVPVRETSKGTKFRFK